MEGVARKAVERAEADLTLHPENPRPAYMGAQVLIVLGEQERARANGCPGRWLLTRMIS